MKSCFTGASSGRLLLGNSAGFMDSFRTDLRKTWPANGKTWVVAEWICRKIEHVNASEIRAIQDEGAQCDLCPLSQVQTGVAVRIKQLCASPNVQHRLREIGLGEEQIIRLLTSQTNFICLVCNARLAISARLAQLILVEPVVR